MYFEEICGYVKQNPAPHENQRTEVNLYNRSIIFIRDRIVEDQLLDLDGDVSFHGKIHLIIRGNYLQEKESTQA